MTGDDAPVRYTPGELLRRRWTYTRTGARCKAAHWDPAAVRRELDRLEAAVTAPSLSAERRRRDASPGLCVRTRR